jgi:hypothetical protein
MAEMILPGVYIEVRPEGLIVPGQVTVGNMGVVGTASKGPIGEAVILGSYADARERFGDYDPWIDGKSDELTLVRALEIAYRHGAATVYAVRITGKQQVGATTITSAVKASLALASAAGPCVLLEALSEGTWGNELSANVAVAEENAFVEDESFNANLAHVPVVKSARNRIRVKPGGGGLEQSLRILYDDTTDGPVAGQVKVDRTTGALTFGNQPGNSDVVLASYMVDKAQAVKVTLRNRTAEEVFTVVSGSDLVHDLEASAWVRGVAQDNADALPNKTEPAKAFPRFSGGDNGATGADYETGLGVLLNEEAHIIVAAGQDDSFGDELAAHCQIASTDNIKRDRIAVVGSAIDATLDDLTGHTQSSDRLIFVAPGIKAKDAAASPPVDVVLPGAYAAAAVAGLLAGVSPHISPTNKTLQVGGLEKVFSSAELTQLVQSRVLALEMRQGFRIVKGITTSTNTAWHQITTRRIVDYAKFGVRSAATSYIGLLNNERVRGRLQSTINSFLNEMMLDEMLVNYQLEVTATRDEERRGIVRVTMTLQPTFSIDFIKVTMFLE